MVKIFHIIADEENWAHSDVRASHRWTLPGIECRFCGGTWGTTALAYPSLQTSHLKLTRRNGCWPVENEQYNSLVKSVRPLLRRNQLIRPGTEFGPLEGKVLGRKVGDFAWVHWWYLLIREESLEKLKKLGFKSPRVVAPILSFGKKEPVQLLEFEIEARASWDTRRLKKAFECKHCGFFQDGLGEDEYPPILGSTVPKNVDLFRVRQAPAIILATEAFMKMVKRLGLQNIVFNEMKVSS